MTPLTRRLAGVLLFSSLVLLPGCKGMDEIEQLSQEYFELLKAGEYQTAYDQSSPEFQYSVPYEEFETYVTEARFDLYIDFNATSYGFNKDDSRSTRTVTGDISFSDEDTVIQMDWIEHDEAWQFLGMQFNPPAEDSSF